MNRYSEWSLLPACALVIAVLAYATTYLTVDQVQRALFPDGRFSTATLTLSDAQVRAIEDRSGMSVRRREVQAWRVEGGGALIVDEVIGKHEYITYALGVNADGSVRGIEIMDYRESYGYEIRDPAWRMQFAGKTSSDPLRLDGDIKNISGATLSCRHITDAVKRLLATYEVVLK